MCSTIQAAPCSRDLNNDGRQELIVVRTTAPLLFLNLGGAKFHLQPDAFGFAQPPQGTFTGASLGEYDHDGWLDIYFCVYSFYQGLDQYRYPTPYFDRPERTSQLLPAQQPRRHL